REAGGLAFLVQPAGGLAAVLLDLARELVADRPRGLDLAPHAGRDLELRREGLLEPLGRGAGGQGLLGEGLEQRQDVAAARDGEIGHGRKRWAGRPALSPFRCDIVKSVYGRISASGRPSRAGPAHAPARCAPPPAPPPPARPAASRACRGDRPPAPAGTARAR